MLIAVVAGLIALSIAIYNKAFSSFVAVDVKFDHTGNALLVDSDVKERGIIVGSVSSITSTGDGAIVHVNLDPSRVSDIPSNVSAQILPKTLFGEQYISLIYPVTPAGAIRAGDTIGQDTSPGALETEKVLGDILPLLTAVQPAQLNETLTALATALQGRGDELGQTVVTLDQYLTTLNPHSAQLVTDLGKLGQVAQEYNNVAPDLLATLQNLQSSAQTLIAHQAGLNSLLVSGTDAANVLNGFLNDNEQRLIVVSGQTTKVYGLLNEYSPEFNCLFTGVSKLYDLAGAAVSQNRIHLSVTLETSNFYTQPYKPGEEPHLVNGFGPNCFGLPDNPQPTDGAGNFQIPPKYQCLNDGTALTQAGTSPNCKAAVASAMSSPEENALVNTLIAGQLGTTPDKVPGIDTLLAAPLLRGKNVVVK
jgi:virulence factor Mce-like protein